MGLEEIKYTKDASGRNRYVRIDFEKYVLHPCGYLPNYLYNRRRHTYSRNNKD